MKSKINIFIFFSFLWYCSFSQIHRLDSLLKVLGKTVDDTARVNLLNELYGENQFSDPDKAYGYAKEALSLSESAGFSRGNGSALNNIGFYYFNKGKSSEALVYYLKANDIFTQIDYYKGKAIVFANIGNIFYNQGNYNKAIEYFNNSLIEAQKINDSSRVAVLLENIGMIYYVQGSYSKALDLCLKSLKIHDKMRDRKGMAYVYGNIALIYDSQNNFKKSLEYYNKSLEKSKEVGDKKSIAASLTNIGELLYLKMGNSKKAIDTLLLALKINKEIDYKDGISKCLQNIGDYYRVQKNYTKALEYFLRADKLSKDLGDKSAESTILAYVGDIYFAQNKYTNALSSYQQSVAIAKELGLKEMLKQNYQQMYKLYDEMGNIGEAYKYQKKYSEIKDSIYTEESIQQMADMQTKYETEKQEDEINLLKKDSELQTLKYSRGKLFVFFISGILLLFIIFGILTFRAYRINKKAKVILEIQNKEISEQKELITKSHAALENEKQKSDNLLLNILPYETAEELKSKGYATVRNYDHVTVLFTDFVGFTRITEDLTPVELVGELNNFFMRFDEIVGKYNLEKIKTIGDSYMCAGGLPHKDIDNPMKVILAALEMQKFVNECNKEKRENDCPLWEIRIGIHTGDIIAGVVGKKKFAYDIWGDTVNTASRMESSGEAGKINISGYTYKYVSDYFDCTYRGKVSVKNKKDIDMYFVNGIKKNKLMFQEGGRPFQKM